MVQQTSTTAKATDNGLKYKKDSVVYLSVEVTLLVVLL